MRFEAYALQTDLYVIIDRDDDEYLLPGQLIDNVRFDVCRWLEVQTCHRHGEPSPPKGLSGGRVGDSFGQVATKLLEDSIDIHYPTINATVENEVRSM